MTPSGLSARRPFRVSLFYLMGVLMAELKGRAPGKKVAYFLREVLGIEPQGPDREKRESA